MNWQPRTVRWSHAAMDALLALVRREPARAGAIRSRVASYAATGVGDVKKLAARSGAHRLRVGTWRVIFVFGADSESGSLTIDILRVVARRDAYRD